jgi:putative glutamine amidotransferase
MTPANSHLATDRRLRVGISWRTSQEELSRSRKKLQYYFEAVKAAAAEPVGISLHQSRDELAAQIRDLDAFVLPGAPSDVNPARYGASLHPKSNPADENRERTDYAILEHALASFKPVLAICYGCQILNVYLGGTLYQDIAGELHSKIEHSRAALSPDDKDPVHPARIEVGGELGQLASACGLEERDGGFAAQINSSHHQSIRDLGPGLRVGAMAPDGVIEAFEPEPQKHWMLGVQWHPERMIGDALSASLFGALVEAARGSLAKR